MNASLLDELSHLFTIESYAIRDPYARPPKVHATGDIGEMQRLRVIAYRIRYLADSTAPAMPDGG